MTEIVGVNQNIIYFYWPSSTAISSSGAYWVKCVPSPGAANEAVIFVISFKVERGKILDRLECLFWTELWFEIGFTEATTYKQTFAVRL